MTTGSSILLIAVGAVLRYALTYQVTGIDLRTLGLIVMCAGAATLLVCVTRGVRSARPRRPVPVPATLPLPTSGGTNEPWWPARGDGYPDVRTARVTPAGDHRPPCHHNHEGNLRYQDDVERLDHLAGFDDTGPWHDGAPHNGPRDPSKDPYFPAAESPGGMGNPGDVIVRDDPDVSGRINPQSSLNGRHIDTCDACCRDRDEVGTDTGAARPGAAPHLLPPRATWGHDAAGWPDEMLPAETDER